MAVARASLLLCALALCLTRAAAFGVTVQHKSQLPFVVLQSGKCAAPIQSLVECEQAAHMLHLSDTTAVDDLEGSVNFDPPGCYTEGHSLKFNSKQSNTGVCSKSDSCICKLAFVLQTSGKCKNPVTTLGECTEAGRTFSLENGQQPADAVYDNEDGVSYDPPGCYFEGEKLKFNAKATNKGACSAIKNNFSDVCVCKQNTNKYSNEVYQDLGMGDCLPDLNNYANNYRKSMGNVTCRTMCSELPSCLAYSEDGYVCRVYSNENVLARVQKLQPAYTWKLTPKCTLNSKNCQGTEITTAVGSSKGTTHCYKRVGIQEKCASEGGVCKCNGNVRYGIGSKYTAMKKVVGSIACNNGVFGDPVPGFPKQCVCQSNGDANLHTCKAPSRGKTCKPVDPTGNDNPPINISLSTYNTQNCIAACEARSQANSGCCTFNQHYCQFHPGVTTLVPTTAHFNSAAVCTTGVPTSNAVAPAELVMGVTGSNACPSGSVKLSQGECAASMKKLKLAAGTGINSPLDNPKDPEGCFSFSWGGHAYAYFNANKGVAKVGRTPICKKQSNGWQCNSNVNWIPGMQYSQTVIDSVNTPGVTSYDDCISKCEALCVAKTGCTGFFYQQHTNTHQICGFYSTPLKGHVQQHMAHKEGAICERTETAAMGTKCTTTAGNAGGAGCVFPFVYQNKAYTSCTIADNKGVAWCATTANYDQDKKWGNCKASATCKVAAACSTKAGNAGGAACHFPFVYQKKTYKGCTALNNNGQLWCATTANYGTDKKWGNCNVGRGSGCTIASAN